MNRDAIFYRRWALVWMSLFWAAMLLQRCSANAAGIEWPEVVEPGSLLVLDAPEDTAAAWGISGTDSAGEAYDPIWREFPGAVAVETRIPGLLTIHLQTSATRGLNKITWLILVGEGEEPTPGPDPPPRPTKIFAVLVYEEFDRDKYTKEQLDAIDSVKMRDYLNSHNYPWYVVDQNTEGSEKKTIGNYLALVESHRPKEPPKEGELPNPHLPRLVVAKFGEGTTADVLADEQVTTEAGILSTLKKYGGE